MSGQGDLFDGPDQSGPGCLVCDPPWLFDDALPGEARGASKHYPCMSVRELCLMPIPRMGRNAVLFLWRVASMQAEALEVAHAWGFEVRSELVWLKTTKHGLPAFGMGHYTRASHEVCLIAVRGSALPDVHGVRSVFEAPIGAHSEKPSRFYALVRQMYPRSRRYELFARTLRPGFTQYGNELGKLGAERSLAALSSPKG